MLDPSHPPGDVPEDRPEDRPVGHDPLLDVRRELEAIEDLPLAERADVFERSHEVVVEELRALELG